MIEKIKQLEKTSRQLEPSPNERSLLIEKTIHYSDEFLNSISNALTYIQSPENNFDFFGSEISSAPIDINEALSFIKKNVDTFGINPASGGHLGYIPGGGIFHSALGDYLAAVTNRYAGVYFASPGAVKMENYLLDWMANIIGYPKTSGGSLTSGGSISNLIGIVTAREAFNLKPKDIEKSVVYLTSQAHHSIEKALRIAGLKDCVKHFIPMDSNYRMDVSELEKSIKQDKVSKLKPWLVVSSAGTTDVGAVDPLSDIGDIASTNGLWHHIDGAYGGFFILCESGEKILQGLEKSDSVIMDPHKSLFLPYGSGAVLIKDKVALYKAHHYQAGYMQDTLSQNEELSPADLSPELSKHFRGLRLWFPLKLLGLDPFKAALEEKIQLARYAYEKLKQFENIELGVYPDLSVVTFRFIPPNGNPNEFNKKLIEEIHKDGRIFLSSTLLNGNFILRIAVVSFRTHLNEIDLTLEILKEKIKI
ncbi:MAG: aminotransferase class V-fold PLP-dependent enzyme [Bacteroidetes bacterium]|nr:aminotransferase class V-fold PLP-dependent enzyme [Bacteroidota bacterium]